MGYFMGVTKYPHIPPWMASQGQGAAGQQQWWLPPAQAEPEGLAQPVDPATPSTEVVGGTSVEVPPVETATELNINVLPSSIEATLSKQFDITMPAMRADVFGIIGSRSRLGTTDLSIQREIHRLRERMATTQLMTTRTKEVFAPTFRPIDIGFSVNSFLQSE